MRGDELTGVTLGVGIEGEQLQATLNPQEAIEIMGAEIQRVGAVHARAGKPGPPSAFDRYLLPVLAVGAFVAVYVLPMAAKIPEVWLAVGVAVGSLLWLRHQSRWYRG